MAPQVDDRAIDNQARWSVWNTKFPIRNHNFVKAIIAEAMP